MSKTKILIIIFIFCFLFGAIYLYINYKSYISIPETRLGINEYYEEMPEDENHFYINLPLDYNDLSKGTYRAFYILSPNFIPSENVIFQIYDNQQEVVGLINDNFDYFNDMVGNDIPYVLIGNRGVYPTVFPEAFRDGKIDYKTALNIYGSENHIEDIEKIRQDLLFKGLLLGDGKINLYGGSGGGVLIQEYISKYGKNVSRVLLESTGAPDLAKENNLTFVLPLSSANSEAADIYFTKYNTSKNTGNISWILFKNGIEGKYDLIIDILRGGIKGNYLYLENFLSLSKNFPFIKLIFSLPIELEVKVRIWELLGEDLVNYNPKTQDEIVLLYDAQKIIMKDFIEEYYKGNIGFKNFNIERNNFDGEVLIFANSGDLDFGSTYAKMINTEYKNSKLLIFPENSHRIDKDDNQMTIVKDFFEKGLEAINSEYEFKK